MPLRRRKPEEKEREIIVQRGEWEETDMEGKEKQTTIGMIE